MKFSKTANQKGIAHIALLLTAVGLIAFIVVSSSAEFKDKIFSTIFPNKPSSFATGTPPLSSLVEFKDANGAVLNCDYTKTPIECTTSTIEVQATIKDLSPLEQ